MEASSPEEAARRAAPLIGGGSSPSSALPRRGLLRRGPGSWAALAAGVVVAVGLAALALPPLLRRLPALGSGSGSPPDLARAATSYDWCDCGDGLANVTVWPEDDENQSVTVGTRSVKWMKWKTAVDAVHWRCNGMKDAQHTRLKEPAAWWSLQLYEEEGKGAIFECRKSTGRLRWNQWKATDYPTSVPFTSDTEGYACFKIPSLLRTNKGTLLAFAEARRPNCSDFAETDLVVKRSTDGGLTWSSLQQAAPAGPGARTVCGDPLVVGNAAPVQLTMSSNHHPGRILLPHTRNNFAFWIAHSDDDGLSWSAAREIHSVAETDPKGPDCSRNMSYFGFAVDKIDLEDMKDVAKYLYELGWGSKDPYKSKQWASKLTGPWQFVGLGPPGSLQIRRGRYQGRVVVPGYHSYVRGLKGGNGSPGQLPISQLYNNFGLGHALLSDDGGDTWRLGFRGLGPVGEGANEQQLAELRNGSLLANSRSLATGSRQLRLQALSDDGGESFGPSRFVDGLPEPFNGCEGSLVAGPTGDLFFSHPDPKLGNTLLVHLTRRMRATGVNFTGRDGMTVWASVDEGSSYPHKMLVDEGLTGYSSLQAYSTVQRVPVLGLLYEQADPAPEEDIKAIMSRYVMGNSVVVTPTRFVFREIPTEIVLSSQRSLLSV